MNEDQQFEDTIRRQNARQAAKKAAAYFADEQAQNNASGRTALYTWGTIAVACFALAASMGLYPNIVPGTQAPANKDATRLAANDTKKPLAPAPVAVPNEPPKEMTAVSDNKQMEADTNTEKVAAIDPMSTGTLSSKAEAIEAPIPEGELGAQIGESKKFQDLVVRYHALNKRRSDLFDSIVPKIDEKTIEGSTVSTLIAGPFQSPEQIAVFCRTMRLQLTVDCVPAAYSGLPLE